MRDGFLERDGVRLHWVEWAPSRPEDGDGIDVYALHGLSSNALFWARLAERLPHRRLVALDQRAHGRSDRPDSGYRMEDVSDDALFALETLDLRRPALLGHSWGGSIALDVAATRPELVGGLGLIDSPLLPMSERLTWDQAQQVMQPPLPRYRALAEAYANARRLLGSAWGPDLEPFVAASHRQDGDTWGLTLSAEVRLQILRQLFGFQPVLLFERLAQLPVLVALAGADAAFRPWKEQGAAELSARMADADVRWYDSAHDIPLILPDQVALDVERLCLRTAWREVEREALALDGDWERPSGFAEWTARDLLAHVSSTQAAMATLLRAPAAAPGAEPFDPDRWNASQVRRRRELPAERLREEVQKGTGELDATLRAADLAGLMPAGPFAGEDVAGALRAMVRHQREHLAALGAALGTPLGRSV
ncbi:MAG: alpha/beta fold hydrolase [Chloroflexota bacterium]